MITTPSRAALQTRPDIQRILIRSWEYIPSVRVAILAIRLLVAAWLVGLGAWFTSTGNAWGGMLLPAAAGVVAIALWVYTTAAKGWPVTQA
jgi:hypothetical protein